MRSMVKRQRLVHVAAITAVVALAAACGAQPGATDEPGGDQSLGGLNLSAGTLLISDGTNVVTIGNQKVTFPTTVTDAAWSPDGSRIAFVDRDGNIATARPDGTGLIVLTKAAAGSVRSRPSWSRALIFYAERKADGTSALMSVVTNGCAAAEEWGMETGDGTSYVDLAPSAALGVSPSRVAFQHDEPSGAEIWVNDTNQRTPQTGKVADGSEPALLPDGSKLAYVGKTGQVYVLDMKSAGGTPIQITFGVDQPKRLTWAPDGQHIAFQTPKDIESVGISPGANSNPTTTLASTSGVPAFLGAQRDVVSRVTGPDPIALAIAASQAKWGSVSTFFQSQGYTGALGATVTTVDMAASANVATVPGPLLLTDGGGLDPRTRAELQRIFGQVTPGYGVPTITIVGNALSADVERTLKDMGFETQRKSGAAGAAAPGDEVCAAQTDRGLFYETLVVVDTSSATNVAVATSLAKWWSVPIIHIDAKAGLTENVRDYLARSSGSIDSVLIVDQAGTIPAEWDKQIGDLVSGPLGHTTGTNPTVPALN
jgi:hypothetical protein